MREFNEIFLSRITDAVIAVERKNKPIDDNKSQASVPMEIDGGNMNSSFGNTEE